MSKFENAKLRFSDLIYTSADAAIETAIPQLIDIVLNKPQAQAMLADGELVTNLDIPGAGQFEIIFTPDEETSTNLELKLGDKGENIFYSKLYRLPDFTPVPPPNKDEKSSVTVNAVGSGGNMLNGLLNFSF